jgi:hypothetical protein
MLVVGCGDDTEGAAAAGAGGSGAGTSVGGGIPVPETFFDACGGKIFDAETGAIDAAEYEKQARAWDLATIDCRLGPKFADVFPNKDDPRPTMYQPPDQQVPMPSSAHLDVYQIGSYSQNDEAYGVVTAQVLYVPDDDTLPGVDRIYVLDWRNNMITISPEMDPDQHGHPEDGVVVPEWEQALGHPVRHPIAAARSALGQSANTMILFQDGLVGAVPWARTFYKFPDGIVPTAVALTNSNEFVLVTVWDTTNPAAPAGRLAILMAHWGLPTVGIGYTHQYDNLGDPSLTLLGYVDLPFATPTFVTAAGNNGGGASIDIYFAPSIAELASAATRAEHAQNGSDPYTWSPIASSGYAIVLSRWENKAAFIDLQPLYQYVQTWLLGSQANYDEATGGSMDYPIPGVWPRTFEMAPEQQPSVAFTVDVEHPLSALAGRGPKLIDQSPSASIQAHIASLDGTVRSFDIREIVNRHTRTPTAPMELASMKTGYNPIAMAWSGDVDPLDPTTTTFGNPRPSYSDSFIVASRAHRELQWVHTDGMTSEVIRSVRDSRLDDPVSLDRNNSFHDAYIFSVGNFTSRKVVTFRVGPMSGQLVRPVADIPPPDGNAAIECGGELEMAGPVFQLSGANIP